MSVNTEDYKKIKEELVEKKVTLVAVSKTKSIEEIRELYDLGQRDFGENYVQELVEKQEQLPKDIRWHFIGHLQSNKVKFIAPFISLIHSVDSFKLLKEINKQAKRQERRIDCLLQVFIAQEETKFGLDDSELATIFDSIKNSLVHKAGVHNTPSFSLNNIVIKGLMGMASFTENREIVKAEFQQLAHLFKKYASVSNANSHLETLSMGMSADYEMAINEGSNMVRIGSLLFGKR